MRVRLMKALSVLLMLALAAFLVAASCTEPAISHYAPAFTTSAFGFEGDPGSIFNSLGLISDGQDSGDPPERLGTERIAYWSYRLLATHTDTPVATQVGEMDLTDGNLYGYEYRRRDDGRAIYVLWRETESATITLPVNAPAVHVTNLIPDRYGNTQEYDVLAEDGQVMLMVGQDPLLVEELADIPMSLLYEDSPFGFHPAHVERAGYPDNGFVDAQYIGIRWHRPPVYAYWFLIQPDLNDPTYDWSLHDQQYGSVPPGIHILANIAPDHWLRRHGYTEPGSYRPVDEAKYVAFVRATVERYDGDGVDDMPGLVNPVKYWQVDNEPKAELTGFADLQRITYQAIKDACPDCTVLIGGAAGFPDDYIRQFDTVYGPILAELGGQYVDVFDFHWYGTADGEYRLRDTITGEDVYAHIRAVLTANGFPPDLPIWITEMGSYSGDPAEPRFPFQSEREQAGDYFKRYIYSLSRGVEKVFAAFGLVEGFGPTEDGYFDHTGLIYDGQDSNDLGLGVKKLGYYTYKKMTEKLEGADWSTLATLHDGTDGDHLYLFRVTREGRPLYIAWWDTFDEPGYTPGDTKPITLTGLSGAAVVVTPVVPSADTGRDVLNYATAFAVTTYPIADGSVTIPLGEDPVIVEEASLPVSQCVQDVNSNGVGDVVDVMATATELNCHVYLPLVVVQWRQPWPSSPAHWVWLEAEAFARSNFPYASHATRGPFCTDCSGQEYLLFLPGRKGRPFDPPGYWYADYALRVSEHDDYRYVWMALSPTDAPFSWTVDDQPPVPASVLELGPTYGSDPTFRWARLDTRGLDLNLDPQDNPHTLRLRRDDPDSPRMQIDAIVLTTDPAWTPSGTEKPPVDRSYLDPYPDYVLYARSWLEHILPDTIPEPDEITTTLSTFATPGEYEPLTFAIYARQPLTDVVVSLTDLTLISSEFPRVPMSSPDSNTIIPTTDLDLRVVRVVTKRRDNHSGPEETELVPEILDYATPQNIPANSSRQYWLTIHVPPDAVPGTYQGTITVAPANVPSRALTLTLEVLPFTLQTPPDRAFSMSYRPLQEFNGVPLPDDPFVYLRQDHQDIRAHGLNSGAVYTPVGVSLEDDGTVQVDYGDLIQHMDLLVELGFTGPAHWRGISRLPRDLQRLGVVTDTLEAVYTEVVSNVLRLREERGWPEVYFYPVDEPFGNPEKEAEFYWLAPLIKQVPGALVEVSLDGVETLPSEADPFTDVRFYSGWSVDRWLPVHTFEEIAADAAASGDRLGFYYNTRSMGGRPEFSRVTWGFYAWNSPFQEEGVWTYHVFFGDPYDDTDGPRGDLAYAYPDPERDYAPTIPTLRWEGVREGIDDLRYLYTLEQALEAARGGPAKAEAVARTEVLLTQLRADLNRYGPEARGIIAYFEPENYTRYRWQIAQAIVALLPAPGGSAHDQIKAFSRGEATGKALPILGKSLDPVASPLLR